LQLTSEAVLNMQVVSKDTEAKAKLRHSSTASSTNALPHYDTKTRQIML